MTLGIAIARAGLLAGVLLAAVECAGQFLAVGPTNIEFTATADMPNATGVQEISVGVVGSGQLGFKLAGVVLMPGAVGPNPLVISPATGTAPATVLVALNPNVVQYLSSGVYRFAVEFAMPGQSSPPYAATFVTLELAPPPPPSVTSLVSAASLQPTVSPGEIVSIFGANIGTPPVSAQYDDTGLYPTALGNTTVTFNGTAAALLFVSTTQINAVVPYEVAGQKTVDVVVTHNFVAAPSVSVPVVDTSPGIFTTTQTGKGQGAILNATGPGASTPNSVDNPSPTGSGVAIFATGGGLLNQAVQDGSIILEVLEPPGFVPAAPVSLTIGGQPAKILYAGAAPYEVAGMLQINATVPNGIGSGAQPVVLTIGANNNASQQVTVAVK